MTDLYAIFGFPVAHSRSPAMHNRAFQQLGVDATYVPLAVPEDKLLACLDAIRVLGVCGLNITLPHKTAIMEGLDEVLPAGRAIGAVNTVIKQGDRYVGTNTDAEGLTRSLQEAGTVLTGAQVTVLGAGGAARAAVYGLAQAGAREVTVAARRQTAAQALVDDLAGYCEDTTLGVCDMASGLAARLGQTSLLIQATSATLSAAAQDFADSLPLDALPDTAVVCDLVYKPRVTSVLQKAKDRNLRTVDGLGMLLHQGALAFEMWTGKTAPLAVMREVLEA